uniref:Uncharacterized protein n=1 Tax=Oryza glumipatula TaxID=40148 RepID=A0A0E0ARB0_9ORYZ
MAIGEDDTCENKDCRVSAGRKATTVGEDDACENKDCRVSAGRKVTTVGEDGACENKDCRVGVGRKASAVEEDNACENKEKRRKMMVVEAASPSSLDCPNLGILIEPFSSLSLLPPGCGRAWGRGRCYRGWRGRARPRRSSAGWRIHTRGPSQLVWLDTLRLLH